MRRALIALTLGGALATALVLLLVLLDRGPDGPYASSACDHNAASATELDAAIGSASAGQRICLTSSADYGIFTGTNRAVTIAAAAGARPVMRIDFGPDDREFTLDGITGMAGTIGDGARDITIRDSEFAGVVDFSGANTHGIVLDGNTHDFAVTSTAEGGPNAKIYLQNSLKGTVAAPAVTIRNSKIANGDLDGIHIGGGSGYLIEGNVLTRLCEAGPNHTDNIQFDTSVTSEVLIRHNLIYAPAGCGTQGITSFDGGTSGVIIEDNVVDIRRPWGIELFSDRNSVVRHNTVVWHADADCEFRGLECGKISMDHKAEDRPGEGTQVQDNVTGAVQFVGGSRGTARHNLCQSDGCSGAALIEGRRPEFAGSPGVAWQSYCLASGSVGKGAASDGLDLGIRC